jgi:quercetin dioxygenase-like cupin family protein
MEVLERLAARVPEGGALQRIVLFGEETGAHHLSAVLVRLPPGHEFPLHTHPGSEDCFFVLSGSGHAHEPGRRLPIDERTGVWIPAGQPHGLSAGPAGMLEVGFQAPAGHRAVPFDGADGSPPGALLVQPLARGDAPRGGFAPAFPGRAAWRWLDVEHALLDPPAGIAAGWPGFECAIVLAAGALEAAGAGSPRLEAFAAIRLAPGESLRLRAAAPGTHLIAVRARAA